MKFNRNSINTETILYGIAGVAFFIIVTFFLLNAKGEVEDNNLAFRLKGDEYIYLGEYDKAIEEYTKIDVNKINDNKQIALINLDLARAYSLKEDEENYKKYIQAVKDLKVTDDEVVNKIVLYEYINEIENNENNGDGSHVLVEGEEALKLNPKNKSLIKTMFAVYTASGKADKARDIIKHYEVDKTSAYDIAEYARLLMITGNLKEGFENLKEAWSLDKDEYKIYDVLVQESQFKIDKMISEIKELEKISPNDIAYKMWLGKIYSIDASKSEEGLKILEQLKNKDTGNIQIKLIEATILQNLNKHEEGDELINEIIQDNKDDYRAYHTAAWFYLKKHDLDKAMEYCKKSIDQNKDYTDNYAFLMPEILKSMDKASLSKAFFRTAIEKDPYNYSILGNLANFYWYTEQNTGEALKYYKLLDVMNPNEPEIKYNLGLLYFNEAKDEEAIDTLKKCIELNKDSLKYHRTLGTVYLTIGKHEEGIKEIRKAFKINEDDILTLNNAGCYYAIYTNDLNRGNYNLKKAVEGINEGTDEYTKKVIKENYSKIREVIDKIEKGKVNEAIKVPDFRLLY